MTSAMLGVHLSILAGTTLPVPLPADVTARVRDVTVTESDDDRTAFTISFDAGRSGPIAVFDTPMLIDSPVKGNARVVVTLTMGAIPSILVDGIVTQTKLVPGSTTRRAELSVTGHDVSVLLDRHEYSAQHPLDDAGQVQNIANKYRTQGIVSNITDPPKSDRPAPNGRIPTQQDTDWAHLQWLAYCHGYVCYFSPGPTPGVSTLYWGPPKRVGVPQPALSVDLGPETNVTGSPEFSQDVLEPELVDGEVQDSDLGAVPIRTVSSIRPPLAAEPVWAVQEPNVRVRQYRESGGDAVRALARAQARTDRSIDCVTATGTLDGSIYGSVLRPRGLVGMRGAGWSNDGLWYVRQVVHHVARGSYTADFMLTREGYGSTLSVVGT